MCAQALTEALSSGHLGGAGLDPHWEVNHLQLEATQPSIPYALLQAATSPLYPCFTHVLHNIFLAHVESVACLYHYCKTIMILDTLLSSRCLPPCALKVDMVM